MNENNEKPEKIFVEGIFVERPHEKAPDFVKGRISICGNKFVPFLKKHMNAESYINCDLKVSKNGKLYLELNTYKATKEQTAEVKQVIEGNGDAQQEYNDMTADVAPEDVPW